MHIDKDTIFEVGEYRFKNFVHLTDEEIRTIWEWRNNDSVRKWMYNPNVIPLESHLKFVHSLTDRKDCYYWLVSNQEDLVGVFNLTDVDLINKSAEPGMYLAPEKQETGIGLSFTFSLLTLVFKVIGCDFLKGAVKSTNKNAYLLNKFMGCKFDSLIDNDTFNFCKFTIRREDFENGEDHKNNIVEFVKFIKSERNGIK